MELMSRAARCERMNYERLFARVFVVVGGVFWATAAVGAQTYTDQSTLDPWIILGVTVVALAVGWFYEYLAALLLAVGAVAVSVYVVVSTTVPGDIWWMVGLVVAPMVIAALLFLLAARSQKICTLEGEGPVDRSSAGAPA